MLLSILKDSVILFLLIYAVLQLAETFVKWLISLVLSSPDPRGIYVVDLSKVAPDRLEEVICHSARNHNEKIFLLIDKPGSELTAVLHILCRKYEQLRPVTREELSHLLMKTDQDIFSENEL